MDFFFSHGSEIDQLLCSGYCRPAERIDACGGRIGQTSRDNWRIEPLWRSANVSAASPQRSRWPRGLWENPAAFAEGLHHVLRANDPPPQLLGVSRLSRRLLRIR